MENNKQIKNGNVFDIGQTVNGVSKFCWFNNTWYYFEERLSREYEYDQSDLTKLVLENEFEEVTFVKNIFADMENNKQTAVEWLVVELNQELNYIPITQWDRIRDLIQRAKEMEKQEILNAFNAGVNDECLGKNTTPEQYYEKNFGGNK